VHIQDGLILQVNFATLNFGELRSKARTLPDKKEQNKLKKWRTVMLVIAKTTRQTTDWLFSSSKVPACQPWGEKPSWREIWAFGESPIHSAMATLIA